MGGEDHLTSTTWKYHSLLMPNLKHSLTVNVNCPNNDGQVKPGGLPDLYYTGGSPACGNIHESGVMVLSYSGVLKVKGLSVGLCSQRSIQSACALKDPPLFQFCIQIPYWAYPVFIHRLCTKWWTTSPHCLERLRLWWILLFSHRTRVLMGCFSHQKMKLLDLLEKLSLIIDYR